MSNKRKIGICHICGQNKYLTFEHIPPEKAFNEYKTYIYKGKQVIFRGDHKFPWDFSDIKGKHSQRGFGNFTLCEECNNNTGSWYGGKFIDFIFQSYIIYNSNSNKKFIKETFYNIYPLAIIKQIISMFASINSPDFFEVNQDLRKFVLDKNEKYLNTKKYGLYVYFLKGPLHKFIGLSSRLNINTRLIRVVTELATMPLGFVLEIEPKPIYREEYNNFDILLFSNFNLSDSIDIHLEIPVLECNSYFPTDYRTREEIFNNYLKNKIEEIKNKK